MKKIITLIAAFFLGITLLQAQSLFDKIDNIANKVDRASSTADRAGKTGGKLMGMFANKKGKVVAGEAKTITIKGGSFASVSKLNEKIKLSKGVDSSKMTYNANGSVIAVTTALSVEELLNTVKSTGLVTDNNVEGMDETGLVLTLK